MILADIYDLLNDLFSESVKFIMIAALAGLAVFIGIRLRKHTDAKKAEKAEKTADADNNTTTM